MHLTNQNFNELPGSFNYYNYRRSMAFFIVIYQQSFELGAYLNNRHEDTKKKLYLEFLLQV